MATMTAPAATSDLRDWIDDERTFLLAQYDDGKNVRDPSGRVTAAIVAVMGGMGLRQEHRIEAVKGLAVWAGAGHRLSGHRSPARYWRHLGSGGSFGGARQPKGVIDVGSGPGLISQSTVSENGVSTLQQH